MDTRISISECYICKRKSDSKRMNKIDGVSLCDKCYNKYKRLLIRN